MGISRDGMYKEDESLWDSPGLVSGYIAKEESSCGLWSLATVAAPTHCTWQQQVSRDPDFTSDYP